MEEESQKIYWYFYTHDLSQCEYYARDCKTLDLNTKDVLGCTLLHYATVAPIALSQKDISIVKSLLENGASLLERAPHDREIYGKKEKSYRFNKDPFDIAFFTSGVLVSINTLHVSAPCKQFESLRYEIGAINGKWYYEVEIVTDGLMQIGWATPHVTAHSQTGIGDDENSWAYDGLRCTKWHKSATKYGSRWKKGDIVGCYLDLELRIMTFTLNGESMGEAFNDLPTGISYHPAASLGESQCCIFNFGGKPFKYPIYQDYKQLVDLLYTYEYYSTVSDEVSQSPYPSVRPLPTYQGTVIHWAVQSNNTSVLEHVFQNYRKDAQISLILGDVLIWTAFDYAVYLERVECFNILCTADNFAHVLSAKDNWGRQPIHKAAFTGNLTITAKLIDLGADINSKDNMGWTPLDFAICEGKIETIQLLLTRGASIDISDNNGTTVIHKCVQYSTPDESRAISLIDLLVSFGADINRGDLAGSPPIMEAVLLGHEHIVKHLISLGARWDIRNNKGNSILHAAVMRVDTKLLEHFVDMGANIDARNVNDVSPFFLAAQLERFEAVRYLASKGAEMDEVHNGELALCYCTSSPETVKFLLDQGAKLDMPDLIATPLHASFWTSPRAHESAEIMINHGADLNVAGFETKVTPLHCAAASGSDSLVKLLVDKGADLTCRSSEGFTPLHYAAQSGNIDCIKILLDAGVIPNVKSNNGLTALDIACIENKIDAVNYFLNAGITVELPSLFYSVFNRNIELSRLLLRSINGIGNQKAALDALIQQGEAARKAGDYERAERYYSGTLELVEHSPEFGLEGRDLGQIAYLLFFIELQRKNYEKCETYLDKTKIYLPFVQDPLSKADAYLSFAEAYITFKRFKEAEQELQEAFEIIQAQVWVETQTAVFQNLYAFFGILYDAKSKLYFEQENWLEASKYCERAMLVFRDLRNISAQSQKCKARWIEALTHTLENEYKKQQWNVFKLLLLGCTKNSVSEGCVLSLLPRELIPNVVKYSVEKFDFMEFANEFIEKRIIKLIPPQQSKHLQNEQSSNIEFVYSNGQLIPYFSLTFTVTNLPKGAVLEFTFPNPLVSNIRSKFEPKPFIVDVVVDNFVKFTCTSPYLQYVGVQHYVITIDIFLDNTKQIKLDTHRVLIQSLLDSELITTSSKLRNSFVKLRKDTAEQSTQWSINMLPWAVVGSSVVALGAILYWKWTRNLK